MAATTNSASAFNVAKYLIWNTTVKINHATGMDIMISSRPTNARNHDLVLTSSQKKMKANENRASMASFDTMPRMTSPMMAVTVDHHGRGASRSKRSKGGRAANENK